MKAKTEGRATTGELRESHATAFGKAKLRCSGCHRGLTEVVKESRRATDHWANARKFGYEDVVARRMSDIWYRETMIELGFNLCDMRRWEHNGDPKISEETFVKMLKAIRDERGLGQFKPMVNYSDDGRPRRELPQRAAQGKSAD